MAMTYGAVMFTVPLLVASIAAPVIEIVFPPGLFTIGLEPIEIEPPSEVKTSIPLIVSFLACGLFTMNEFPLVLPKSSSAPFTLREDPLPTTLIAGPFTTLILIPLMSLAKALAISIVLPPLKLNKGLFLTVISPLSSAMTGPLARTLLLIISVNVLLVVMLVSALEEPTSSMIGRVASDPHRRVLLVLPPRQGSYYRDFPLLAGSD